LGGAVSIQNAGILEASVVIPVYNAAETLHEVVQRTTAVLDALFSSFEIILIDDGSADSSWEVLRELQVKYPKRIVAIQLMRNFGQHNALMCGLRHVRGRVIITIDDDLQTPPEEIPKLVERMNGGNYDLVYGEYHRKRHDKWRNLGSGLVKMFYRIVFRSKIKVTSFRVMQRQLCESVLSYELNFTYVDGLLAWNTQRIGSIIVDHHPRASGRSGYSPAKLFVLAMNLFTNFSILPLQLISALGFAFALMGFTLGSYFVLMSVFKQIVVPGYASIIVAVFVLGGAQMLALGMIGEYLGRLHLNVNRKPQYGIRSILSEDETEPEDISDEIG
jgi:glycosyltransferase involved in cell wall biosynthesis